MWDEELVGSLSSDQVISAMFTAPVFVLFEYPDATLFLVFDINHVRRT